MARKRGTTYRTPDGPFQPQREHWLWRHVCARFDHDWFELTYFEPEDFRVKSPKFCARCGIRDYDGLDFKQFQCALDRALEWFKEKGIP